MDGGQPSALPLVRSLGDDLDIYGTRKKREEDEARKRAAMRLPAPPRPHVTPAPVIKRIRHVQVTPPRPQLMLPLQPEIIEERA